MVASSYFEPPSTIQYWAPRNVLSNGRDLEGPDTLQSPTFSQALNQFRLFLRQGDSGCARFCILSSSDDHSIQSRAFGFKAKLFATLEQLERKYQAPMSALLYLVRSEWHLADNSVGHRHTATESKRIQIQPQSRSKHSLKSILVNCTPTFASKEISLELSWFGHAPRFEGAVYTYLWRPHTLPPKTIDAQFLVSEDDEGSQNVVINLRGWDRSTGSLNTYKLDRLAGPPGYSRPSSNIGQELQLYLFAAFKQLIVDSDVFVDSAYEEMATITYDGRASPGNEKLYYLLHISDCCRRATSELAHASSLLKKPPVRESPGATEDKALKAWFETALKDIDFLIGQLDDIETQVLAIRLMIKDQLDLRNGRRTALIGLLAVIYIPFAFLSSLFGMNIKDPLWGPIIPGGLLPGTSGNVTARANTTKALNHTAQANVTGMALNQTDVLVSAISSSGGYLWSFKIYWIIAAPVTFATILLPLIAGPTARYIVKFSDHNRAYSRFALSLLGSVGEIISAIIFPPTLFIIIFCVAYGILAFGMLSWASVPGRSQLAWAAFAMVYAYSLMLDAIVFAFDKAPVTALVPLLFLNLTLFRSEILRLFIPKTSLFARESLVNFLLSKHRPLGWILMRNIGLPCKSEILIADPSDDLSVRVLDLSGVRILIGQSYPPRT
ncbi:MAG: hypothetical protein Q9180_004312 [Flavoplaca navasiana]